MNCHYCYYYHGADNSWADMPRLMPEEWVDGLIGAVAHLHRVQKTPPLVVFHGGEPLLFGISRFLRLVDRLLQAVPSALLSLQTNGTIYNDVLEAGLVRHRENLTFSLSVDGFREENDRYRLGLSSESKYDIIEGTIVRARDAGVLDSILIVVDPDVSPDRIYHFMKWAGARSYNLLLRDGDHESLPPGKAGLDTTEAGAWLWKAFSLYASECPTFRIRIFDEIAASLLTRPMGHLPSTNQTRQCVLTVDTDGEIKQVDTLRVNGTALDRLAGTKIGAGSIADALQSAKNINLMHIEDDVSDECSGCKYFGACGGGYLQHRYGRSTYKNPSIYCADYLHLLSRMEAVLCR